MPAFIVEVDWLNNGNFTDAGEDVTARVLSRAGLTTKRGSSLSRGMVPPEAGAFMAELDNRSKDYSLLNLSSPLVGLLKPVRPVRIRYGTGAATTYHVWRGYLSGIPQYPERERQSVGIPADGVFTKLRRKGFSTALYVGIKVNTAMQHVLALLGMDSATYRDFDLAETSLLYWWVGPTDDLYDVFIKLYLSEGPGARLYEDAQGRIAFRNRLAKYTTTAAITSQATFSSVGAEPTFIAPFDFVDPWKNLVNAASTTHVERTLAALAAVWTYNGTLTIDAGQTKVVTVSASEPFIYALNPVLTTDYTYTGGAPVSLTLNRLNGIECLLTIVGNATTATVISGLQVRAQSVTVSRSTTLNSTTDAAASIADYGLQPFVLESYPDIDEDIQQDMLDAFVAQNMSPVSLVRFTVISGDATRFAAQMSLEIGNRITLVEPNSGLNTAFHIESVEHTIIHAGLVVRTTFGVRQAVLTTGNPFVLDVSTLDGTDVLWY